MTRQSGQKTTTAGSVRFTPHVSAQAVDLPRLEERLRARVRGRVRLDAGARAVWSTDSSNFRMPPLAVVEPLDIEDVTAAVTACREAGAPITNRGGGTSLSGETTNTAVIIDTSRHLTGMAAVDVAGGSVWVEPGAVNDDVRRAAQPHGLTFGPDPSTHDRCTIGGNLGNNSCGVHSVMAGRTDQNTLALDVVLYDGTRMTLRSAYDEDEIERTVAAGGRIGELFARLRIIRDRYGDAIRSGFPDIPRRVSGYNLPALLPEHGFNLAASVVGSEGTCVTVLRAQLRLVPWPAHRRVLVAGFDDITAAADAVPTLLRFGPIGLEAFDQNLVNVLISKHRHRAEVRQLPRGGNYLIVEFGDDDNDALAATTAAARAALGLGPDRVIDVSDEEARPLWQVREAALGAVARMADGEMTWPGWEDSAVAPARLGPYLRDLIALFDEHGWTIPIYGHFGDGCVHLRIPFDLTTRAGIAEYREFMEAAARLVVRHGGSLSGEHGDGQQRADLLPLMFSEELLAAMREFKHAWDPDGRMNPGKLVDPLRLFHLDENLRLGADYRPQRVDTFFPFSDDQGSFEHATLRCVGVGKCRVGSGQLMCPSYQTLRQEEHSTRGRARVLFEMLQGEVVTDGWRSQEVFDALDLCLSCKGCKRDCPVNVDMATYKAEFLAHYYDGRLRPRHAYAMGLIMYAARVGARMPRLANAALHAPVLSGLVKRLAGIHPRRHAPTFATETFRDWFASRDIVNPGSPPVLLFPDTFTNHFHTDVAKATCEVLEHAGFQVTIPPGILCCGRPLFDYGMLREARRLFRRVLTTLDEQITAGIPMVVPEPSCCASFRDELVAMFPDDLQAHRLAAQTHTLAEFLEKFAPNAHFGRLDEAVIMQRHCHHSAIMGTAAEQRLLEHVADSVEVPDTGCCGLAGSWGFERAKFDISMTCGERALFPLLRDAAPDVRIIADGFSCRTQIEQGVGKNAIHLAQFLREASQSHDEEAPRADRAT